MRKNLLIKLLICAFFLLGIFFYSVNILSNRSDYQDVMDGSYNTPWFDNRWWVDPYTNWKLSSYPTIHRNATNVVGDIWLVKEIQVKDKTWWTREKILSKHND